METKPKISIDQYLRELEAWAGFKDKSPYRVERGSFPPEHPNAKPLDFPFDRMTRVGDNFFVPVENYQQYQRMYQRVMTQARKYRKRTGNRDFSISCRTEEGGFRAWRRT